MHALIWISLLGCVAPEIIVSTDGPEDTAADSGTSGDTDTPEDTGDTGEDTPPEPTYDINRWNGSLHFSGDYFGNNCDEEVTESGVLLPKDDRAYETCPTCNAVYRLMPSAEAACSLGAGFEIPLEQPTTRGVLFGDGFAMIYAIEGTRASLLDADASYEEGRLTFSYSVSSGGDVVTVTGATRFPQE